MRKHVLGALVALIATVGCSVRTIPVPDGSMADAGRDSGVRRPDAGQFDAGDRLDEVLIYAHSADTLYTFSPYDNSVTDLGQFQIPGTEPPWMLDLAVDGEGTIITVGYTEIYVVDPLTMDCTIAMTYRTDSDPNVDPIFALSFIPPDESPTGSEILIGATNAGELYRIDFLTDDLIPLGSYPDNWGSSGDITSVAGLGTFATLRQRDANGQPIAGEPDAVAQITLRASGGADVRIIGTTRTAGGQTFTALFGLGYWGRRLYGFTRDGELLEIDRETGISTIVTTDTGATQFYGAGVTTTVPFLI